MGVGTKIKTLIKEKGLTQRDFATTIDENLTQLNKVLNGERSPSFELLDKTVNFFEDVDLNWLLRDKYITSDYVPEVREEGSTTNAEILEDIQKIEDILKEMKTKVAQ